MARMPDGPDLWHTGIRVSAAASLCSRKYYSRYRRKNKALFRFYIVFNQIRAHLIGILYYVHFLCNQIPYFRVLSPAAALADALFSGVLRGVNRSGHYILRAGKSRALVRRVPDLSALNPVYGAGLSV